VVGENTEGPDTSMPVDQAVPESPANDHQSDADPGPSDPRTWGHRFTVWRDSIRRRPAAYRIYRLVVGVVGGAIVVGGLAFVPLPGPGWLIVFVGLAVLATEFVWADRLEKFARNQVKSWTQWLGRQSIAVQILVGLLTCIFVVLVIYALFAVTGVPGWVPDSWVPDLPGL
jgi:uncharacterized protein (TIGR02611 family)